MHFSHYLRHRHFLAFPVFLCLLGAALSAGAWQLPGSLIPSAVTGTEKIVAAAGDTPFAFSDGTHGVVRKGGILRRDDSGLTVEHGAAIIGSPTLFAVHIGDVTVTGFDASALVTVTDPSFTVLPLTSSLILGRGEFRFVLPGGSEASWKKNDEIPVLFSPENLLSQRPHIRAADASALRDARDTFKKQEAPALRTFERPPELPAVLDALMFPEAGSRLRLQSGRARVAELQQMLLRDDPAARNVLSNDDVRLYLSSDDLPADVLPILFAEAKTLPSVAQQLVEFIRMSDLWLALSFHDDYRIAAWADSGPLAMQPYMRLQRWLQLPQTDRSEAVPDRVVVEWGREVATHAKSLQSPQDFVTTLLASMEDFRLFADQSGLPERLRRYAAAVREIAGPLKNALSADAQAQYAAWDAVDAIAPYVEAAPEPMTQDVAEAASSSSVVTAMPSIVRFFPADVEARAKKMLMVAGASTTLKTGITAESPSTVRVHDLQFTTPDGPQSFAFVLDLKTSTVSSITHDGQPLPYPMSLEAFTDWVKGE